MPTHPHKKLIPWLMVTGRAILGPIMVAGQFRNWDGTLLASLVITALLSDIFDGILARRWNTDTAALRLCDSMADTVFYIGVAIALWIGQPTTWHTHAALLITLLSLEATRFAFDFAKFRKPASYHSYLAKTWGLLLAVAVVAAFATHRSSVLISAALALGILCNIEGLTMSLLLPVWRRDVKTLRAAWHLRREIYAQRREVVSRKPATGDSASMEAGFSRTSGATPGR